MAGIGSWVLTRLKSGGPVRLADADGEAPPDAVGLGEEPEETNGMVTAAATTAQAAANTGSRCRPIQPAAPPRGETLLGRQALAVRVRSGRAALLDGPARRDLIRRRGAARDACGAVSGACSATPGPTRAGRVVLRGHGVGCEAGARSRPGRGRRLRAGIRRESR